VIHYRLTGESGEAKIARCDKFSTGSQATGEREVPRKGKGGRRSRRLSTRSEDEED
jgi:hypothetical protein